MCLLESLLWLGDHTGDIHLFDFQEGVRVLTIDRAHRGRVHDIQRVGKFVWSCADDSISIWNTQGELHERISIAAPVKKMLAVPERKDIPDDEELEGFVVVDHDAPF